MFANSMVVDFDDFVKQQEIVLIFTIADDWVCRKLWYYMWDKYSQYNLVVYNFYKTFLKAIANFKCSLWMKKDYHCQENIFHRQNSPKMDYKIDKMRV